MDINGNQPLSGNLTFEKKFRTDQDIGKLSESYQDEYFKVELPPDEPSSKLPKTTPTLEERAEEIFKSFDKALQRC